MTAYRQAKRKLKCGKGVRIPVHAGDVVILHQRVGTTSAANMGSETAVHVEFKLHHVEMDMLLTTFNGHDLPFVGFDGLNNATEQLSQSN